MSSNIIDESLRHSLEEAADLKIEDLKIVNLDGRILFTGETQQECVTWINGYVKGYLDSLRYAIDRFAIGKE